jgi:hypothetical protein
MLSKRAALARFPQLLVKARRISISSKWATADDKSSNPPAGGGRLYLLDKAEIRRDDHTAAHQHRRVGLPLAARLGHFLRCSSS